MGFETSGLTAAAVVFAATVTAGCLKIPSGSERKKIHTPSTAIDRPPSPPMTTLIRPSAVPPAVEPPRLRVLERDVESWNGAGAGLGFASAGGGGAAAAEGIGGKAVGTGT